MKIENGILFTKVLLDYSTNEEFTDYSYNSGAIMLDTIDAWYDVTDKGDSEVKIVTNSGEAYTIKEKFQDVSNAMIKFNSEYKPFKVSN